MMLVELLDQAQIALLAGPGTHQLLYLAEKAAVEISFTAKRHRSDEFEDSTLCTTICPVYIYYIHSLMHLVSL